MILASMKNFKADTENVAEIENFWSRVTEKPKAVTRLIFTTTLSQATVRSSIKLATPNTHPHQVIFLWHSSNLFWSISSPCQANVKSIHHQSIFGTMTASAKTALHSLAIFIHKQEETVKQVRLILVLHRISLPLRMLYLQSGQVALIRSHLIMHVEWKWWLHGSAWSSVPSSYGIRQTQHS